MSQRYCVVIFKWGTQQENAVTKQAVTSSCDCSMWQSEYLVKGMKGALLHSKIRNIQCFKVLRQAAKLLFMRYVDP